MAIAIPMLMLLLFGYALTLDVDNVPMVVWDQSGTPASRELVSRFERLALLRRPQASRQDYPDIERAIDGRRGDGRRRDPPRLRRTPDDGPRGARCS